MPARAKQPPPPTPPEAAAQALHTFLDLPPEPPPVVERFMTGEDLPSPELPPPTYALKDAERGLWIVQGNCLEVMNRLRARHPGGLFDLIFADPPYFLSNGGITCHAGRMVRVDKGHWDKSQGPELNHEFNRAWLERCRDLLKPHGSLWVSGTHHVIHSVGFAMQQLGMKLLNAVTWEKPNPPPNLSCRYFTHSTETLLWAAKSEKSRHTFNYPIMKGMNGGKQMKDVWRLPAPPRDEKLHGKHPTQKPLALLERILLASSHRDAFVLDPFLGSGTTALAALRTHRHCLGIEQDPQYVRLAIARTATTPAYQVCVNVLLWSSNDLDLSGEAIDRSAALENPPADRIFHEYKLVFLSSAQSGPHSVVETRLNVTLQEAWQSLPEPAKRTTSHIVTCETTLLRLEKP